MNRHQGFRERVSAQPAPPSSNAFYWAGLGDLPAGLRAAAAGLGTFAHGFHVGIFAALCRTSFANIGADGAKLIFEPGVPREESHAHAAYRRALMTEPDAFRHLGRIVCEALFGAG
jgi:hypothetical protein